MTDARSQDETSDAAIAAFALAQTMFWQLVQKGLLEKSEATRMLEKLVEANLRGDRQHQLAGLRLAGLSPRWRPTNHPWPISRHDNGVP